MKAEHATAKARSIFRPAQTRHQSGFENALPCPECKNDQGNLWPVRSAHREGIYAVMCNCGHIGGDCNSIAHEITTWKREARAERHP